MSVLRTPSKTPIWSNISDPIKRQTSGPSPRNIRSVRSSRRAVRFAEKRTKTFIVYNWGIMTIQLLKINTFRQLSYIIPRKIIRRLYAPSLPHPLHSRISVEQCLGSVDQKKAYSSMIKIFQDLTTPPRNTAHFGILR